VSGLYSGQKRNSSAGKLIWRHHRSRVALPLLLTVLNLAPSCALAESGPAPGTPRQCQEEPAASWKITGDRDNPGNWAELGWAELAIGNLGGATSSFARASRLGEERGDNAAIAAAAHGDGAVNGVRFRHFWAKPKQALALSKAIEAAFGERPTGGPDIDIGPPLRLFDAAERSLKEAIGIDEAGNRPDRIVRLYTDWADLQAERDNFAPEVGTLLQKAIAAGEAAKLEEELIAPYHRLADFYRENGLNDAEHFYLRALLLAEKMGKTREQLAIVRKLEGLYGTLGERAKSAEMKTKADQIASVTCPQPRYSLGYIFQSDLYLSNDTAFFVETLADQVLQHERDLDQDFGAATTLTLLALLKYKLKAYDEAELPFLQALKLHEEAGRQKEAALIYFDLGALSFAHDNRAMACQYWTMSMDADPSALETEQQWRYLDTCPSNGLMGTGRPRR